MRKQRGIKRYYKSLATQLDFEKPTWGIFAIKRNMARRALFNIKITLFLLVSACAYVARGNPKHPTAQHRARISNAETFVIVQQSSYNFRGHTETVTMTISTKSANRANIEDYRASASYTRDTSVFSSGHSNGMETFRLWVIRNYRVPKKARKEQVHGKVEAAFVVEKDGSLSSFEILEDLGHGTGEELVRVLSKAKKWSPGIQDGKPVRVKYMLPIYIDARKK